VSEIPEDVIERALCVYLNGPADDDLEDFRAAARVIAEHVRAEDLLPELQAMAAELERLRAKTNSLEKEVEYWRTISDKTERFLRLMSGS